MAFKVFTLLINGLVPVIPAWFIMNSHPETAVIKPWPIVWTLLGVNVLFILIAWKHLGYTRRQRETEALMLIINAFVPLATYNWLFPAETQFSFPVQILLYCFMQVVWIVSIEIRTHPTAQSRGTSLIGQTILRIQRGGSEEAPMQHA